MVLIYLRSNMATLSLIYTRVQIRVITDLVMAPQLTGGFLGSTRAMWIVVGDA